jgi:hypothetical protein
VYCLYECVIAGFLKYKFKLQIKFRCQPLSPILLFQFFTFLGLPRQFPHVRFLPFYEPAIFRNRHKMQFSSCTCLLLFFFVVVKRKNTSLSNFSSFTRSIWPHRFRALSSSLIITRKSHPFLPLITRSLLRSVL